MVNAATDLVYEGKFYPQGTKLPEEAVKLFELKDPSLLSNYILVNSKWIKIDDPKIKGYVEEIKNLDLRLKRHFKLVEKGVEKQDQMLKTKKNIYTKEGLEGMSFIELRKIGDKLGVFDRSKKGLIKEILKSQ